MTFSMQDAIRQNTIGFSEGYPVGVPTSYAWYTGAFQPVGFAAAPSDFTAVTGWGQVYQESGEPAYANQNARVEVANARTYVHLRSTGEWVLVQNQPTNQIVGGHFVTNFAGNAGSEMNVTIKPDGTASFATPPTGYNDHFWQAARGTYRAGDVDAVYVQMDMRVTDPNLNLIANVGADWWRSATAGYVDGFSNNPGAGMSNWVDLSTEWTTLAFYSSSSIFQADPPPPLLGATVETRPTLTSFSPDSATVGDGVTSAGILTLAGTARAGVTVAIYDGTTRIGTATANSSGAWNFTTGQLSNSSHAFTARNLDATGAAGLTSSALTVRVDTIAPAAPRIVSFSPDTGTVGDGITSSSLLTLSGTAEAGSIVRVFDGSTQLGTATANGSGQWSFATAQLSNATHSFSATATDAAGNTSAASSRMSVRVEAVGTPTPAPSPPPPDGLNLLVNGSFEATTVAAGQWAGSSSISGWTALSGSRIELWNNVNGVRATNGANFGELDFLGADDGFYQTVRTVAGQSYNLSFDSRSRPGFTAATCTIEVWWNDRLVASVPPGGDWATYSFTVNGTGGQDRLTFREARGQGGDGLGALYDNVSLVATTAAPPPPTSGANVLLNGSFEATTLAAGQWGGFNSIPGWTAVAGGTIELWNNLNGVRATNGGNFGELDYLGAADGLYQAVNTEAGQRYALSFDARSRPGFTAATCTIEVLWNDTVVARVPPGSDWGTYNFTMTGTGGQDRLTFREAQGQGADGLGALYDNVSLVAVGTTSSASMAAVGEMDRAMDLVTQYSAATVAVSNVAPSSVFDQANKQEGLAPTLTQTHQLT